MRNNIDNSSVFKDFVKIAQSYGWVKEADDAKVIQDKYNVTDGTGAELIDKAHPDEIWVAEALGDGGLVENQNEQHETLMSILYKMPEGSLLGRHAELVTSLKKTASKAYLNGNISSYNRINNSIDSLNDNFYKKAFWGQAAFFLLQLLGMATMVGGKAAPGIVSKLGLAATIGAFATGLLSKLTSIQESIPKDLTDMLELLNSITSDPNYKEIHSLASLIIKDLKKWEGKFNGEVPKDLAGMRDYLKSVKEFQTDLRGNISSNVQTMESKGSALFGGMDKPGRVGAKFNSLIDSVNSLDKTISQGLKLGGNEKVVEEITKTYGGEVRKPGLLGVLERAGISAKDGIISALQSLEEQIAGTYPNVGDKIRGKLTDGNKTIAPEKLEKLLSSMKKV